MKRIYTLDLMKLVFAYVIAFFHFGIDIAPGSTVTVQIFFMISGFFLAKKYYTRSHGRTGYSHWDYTLDHVKSLYPHYLFSYCAYFLYETAREVLVFLREPAMDGIRSMLLRLYDQVPNLLFLQSSHYFHDNMNYPVWQISALVIASFFVYGLLCHNEKLSRTLIFPAAILMIQSILHSGVDLFANFGPFYMPLLRAFSPLCIGVLTYYFTTTPYFEKLKAHPVAFNLFAIYALAMIFVFNTHGNIFLITTPVLILSCYDENSWLNRAFNRSIFKHCGKLSYAIYLNHALIARFVLARLIPKAENLGLNLPQWQQGAIYFCLLTVYSIFTLWLVDTIVAKRKAKATA